MNANRLSANVALGSQALFAILLAFSPWSVAAWGALSLATIALVLGISAVLAAARSSTTKEGTRISFPRLQLGNFLCFASMSTLSLRFDGTDFLPYTGLFFALSLALASLVDAALPAIKRRSLQYLELHSLALGLGYTFSAILHITLFPHPAYLYLGVGSLILVSAFDIASGIVSSMRVAHAAERTPRSGRAKRDVKPPRGLAVFMLFALALNTPRAPAQEGRSEEETFTALFGEELQSESAGDLLRILTIEVDTPSCFTPSYIRSFARELETGQRLTRSDLESAMKVIRERMEFSHRFYQALLSYRTVGEGVDDAGETEVAVMIKVSEGFWWDFNFEPYDVWIGYSNLFREGKELGIVAGLNTQALRYRDPAIANGVLYYSVALGHRLEEDANVTGSAYLYESLSSEGEAGLSLGDDLRLGLGASYAAYRATREYFLYPDYEVPDQAELERMGVARGLDEYDGIATFFLRSSLGAYSYQRRGGLKGRVEGILSSLVPQADSSETGLKATVSGDLRLDAARRDAGRLLCLTLHERIEYFPRNLDGGRIPEPLWADIDEGRYRSGLVSGEFASLSRVSLGLDPISVVGLGFTRLSLIPELYYEFTVVKKESYGSTPRWAQNVGFLIKGAFSAPVNRVFSLGLAFSLPSEAAATRAKSDAWEPAWTIFLEIE